MRSRGKESTDASTPLIDLLDSCQLVPDVHQFPSHIACDTASESEIVVPIVVDGKTVAVIDIDSTQLNTFTQLVCPHCFASPNLQDADCLENVAATLAKELQWKQLK